MLDPKRNQRVKHIYSRGRTRRLLEILRWYIYGLLDLDG
jgi:hypothetical protein